MNDDYMEIKKNKNKTTLLFSESIFSDITPQHEEKRPRLEVEEKSKFTTSGDIASSMHVDPLRLRKITNPIIDKARVLEKFDFTDPETGITVHRRWKGKKKEYAYFDDNEKMREVIRKELDKPKHENTLIESSFLAVKHYAPLIHVTPNRLREIINPIAEEAEKLNKYDYTDPKTGITIHRRWDQGRIFVYLDKDDKKTEKILTKITAGERSLLPAEFLTVTEYADKVLGVDRDTLFQSLKYISRKAKKLGMHDYTDEKTGITIHLGVQGKLIYLDKDDKQTKAALKKELGLVRKADSKEPAEKPAYIVNNLKSTPKKSFVERVTTWNPYYNGRE